MVLLQKKHCTKKNLLVLFHGLEGSSSSQYSVAFAKAAIEKGWSFVVVNFRGCSGEINFAPRSYHAGDSEEVNWILQKINLKYKFSKIFCVGISLGGNVLLKWVSEHDQKKFSNLRKISGIASISAPLDLRASGEKIDAGLNKYLYASYFLKSMKNKARLKWNQFPGLFNIERVLSSKTIRQFDNFFTAPVHGFMDVIEYWEKSSALRGISKIKTPALVINAKNDPIVPYESVKELEKNKNIEFLGPDYGGHVGFTNKFSIQSHAKQFLKMPRVVVRWLENT